MNRQTTHNIRRKVFWSTEVPKFHTNLSLSPSSSIYSYSILVQLNCTECGGEESKLKNETVKLTKVQRTRKMIHTMNIQCIFNPVFRNAYRSIWTRLGFCWIKIKTSPNRYKFVVNAWEFARFTAMSDCFYFEFDHHLLFVMRYLNCVNQAIVEGFKSRVCHNHMVEFRARIGVDLKIIKIHSTNLGFATT